MDMSETPRGCDILIIGGGIAGASSAAALGAAGAYVILLEMEPQPGYHTTGRSAATFVSSYGNDTIRVLNAASRPFFDAPPEGFADFPLLSPRGALFAADEAHVADLQAALDDPANAGLLESIDTQAALAYSPALKPESAILAAYEADAADIDVNALLQGYLRQLQSAGGRLVTSARVDGMLRRASAWQVETNVGIFTAPTIVNAAGAWADEIAALAGTASIGLVPKRRTALTFDPGVDISKWPLTISADENWYFRPEGGDLLISPADETPQPPNDAQPDEMDVAVCIDRIQNHTTLNVERLVSKRAGLRSFVFDKSPVAGFADDVDGFFWLAGQGGYGIQTAPALAAFAAGMIRDGVIAPTLQDFGLNAEVLAPGRLCAAFGD
ncbi:MAG: FAD-binding oxidoreductase [Rhodospirillaceae bacterium]|nr:FAD-binding oxidoreductase [Rhodospirillaceae bacterium]